MQLASSIGVLALVAMTFAFGRPPPSIPPSPRESSNCWRRTCSSPLSNTGREGDRGSGALAIAVAFVPPTEVSPAPSEMISRHPAGQGVAKCAHASAC